MGLAESFEEFRQREAPPSNRLRWLKVSAELLVSMCRDAPVGTKRYRCTNDAIPDGCFVVHVHATPDRIVHLLLSHESFSPIAEGSVVPLLEPTWEVVDDE